MYQYLDLGNNVIIPMYNLMIGIGIIFGILTLDYQIRNKSITHKKEICLYIGVVVSMIIGFLGAKVFNLIYMKQSFSFNNILNSGMTYYGGFVCGIIVYILYNAIRKENILYMINILMPSVILAHAFGRFGCFFGGCCFGKPANNILGVNFPNDSIPFRHYGHNVSIYPTQLFESFFLFILFFVTLKFIPLRLNLTIYLLFYGLFRFFIEYLRADNRGIIFTNLLSPSQFISIIFLLFGTILYISKEKKQITAPITTNDKMS
jgi:phosphatidylglycerol:prolipoprotein diacylglycerol transferase